MSAPILILAVEGMLIVVGATIVAIHFFGSTETRTWFHHIYTKRLHY